MMALAALAAAAVVGFALRARHLNAMRAIASAGRTLGADGVIVGGEGFTFARPGAPAVLLVHGGGDTPQTLRYLGNMLFERGYHVEAPLLPGHGRSVDDFTRVSAREWYDAEQVAYSTLVSEHGWVGVVGLSMGGALAVRLAANAPGLPALGLIAPYLSLPRRYDLAARTAWLWGPLVPVFRSADGVSILDPVERARSRAYGVFTAAALRALRDTVRLAADALPSVVAPTLVIQSREDNRISVASAEAAFVSLGSAEKRLEWTSGAAHIITVDYGRDRVNELTVAWLDGHRNSGVSN
jgi:carboxylesterase